jgi:hypothetical protein
VDIGGQLDRDTSTRTSIHLQGTLIPECFDAGGSACWLATATDRQRRLGLPLRCGLLQMAVLDQSALARRHLFVQHVPQAAGAAPAPCARLRNTMRVGEASSSRSGLGLQRMEVPLAAFAEVAQSDLHALPSECCVPR